MDSSVDPTEFHQAASQILRECEAIMQDARLAYPPSRNEDPVFCDHIRDTLLNMRLGFALLGGESLRPLGQHQDSLDLAFYHTQLHCFCAVRVTDRSSRPGDIDSLYRCVVAMDESLRREGDKTTLGLLVSQDNESLVVTYMLRNWADPTGKAQDEIKTTQNLPLDLEKYLPKREEMLQYLSGTKHPGPIVTPSGQEKLEPGKPVTNVNRALAQPARDIAQRLVEDVYAALNKSLSR